MKETSIDELCENFHLFDDWEERYRYLIDLGRRLPQLKEADKLEENLVRGCTSRVWMLLELNNQGHISINADSDAHIVRGLIAVLMAAYQNKTPEQITNLDIKKYFKDIGLDQHLSPNRRNGFFSMVERIQSFASTAASKP